MNGCGLGAALVRVALVGVITLGSFGISADAAAGQSTAALVEVDQLVRDGRVGPARDILLEWWDEEWGAASRSDRERALWLRGRLTLDPSEAASSYRRILTEYPSGAYADQALLRLGYLSAIQGDTVSASRWFTILQRDHPSSPVRLEARAWMTDPAVTAAVARGTSTRSSAPSEEVVSPPPVVQPAPRQVEVDPPRTEREDLERPLSDRYSVQLGAFASEGRAYTLSAQLEQAGFEVRVVQVTGSDLWRVRAGRFADDEASRGLYDRIVAAGFEATVVSDADREESRG